jgi:fibronectin-binding autotransporter adhesin
LHTKTGLGTLDLTGSATLLDGACVQQGTLRASGTLAGSVKVESGAVLRGTGTITGPVVVDGRLAPGNSPGTLTLAGSVTMSAGSTFQADINGTGTGSGAGNYSRLLVTGATSTFDAGGATLEPVLVGITGLGSAPAYVPQVGDTFPIVSAEGGISGRFAPLAQPEGLAEGTRMAAFYDPLGSHSIDLRVLPTSYAGMSMRASAGRCAMDSRSTASTSGFE